MSFIVSSFVTCFFIYSYPSSIPFILANQVLLRENPYRIECTPHKHIVFLKTHKCASTTIQNIFLRYGYTNNLTFALPLRANYLGNPKPFKTAMLPPQLLPQHGKVDIFCVHTRMNEAELRLVMPNDTIWITVVRNPPTLYESLFSYYHLNSAYQMSLLELGKKPLEELKGLNRHGGKLGRNQMLFDLGADEDISVSDLRELMTHFDKLFGLVMIAEKMDESLILLRHLLCWSIHDLVTFTKNARRTEVKPKLSEQTIKKLTDLNSADVVLYEHFLAKHREKVAEFGRQRMADEVVELQNLRDEYMEDCGARQVKGKDSQLRFKEYSGLVSSYVMNNNSDENCQLISYPELTFLELIRQRQMTRLKKIANS